MGKEDALRGGASWLVEPLYGNHIHRLVQSTHHQGAQALAKTHRLSLAAFGVFSSSGKIPNVKHVKWLVEGFGA
jgi:hypothetical protein